MAAADPGPLACFKTYDIRGRVGDELDEGIAWRIGRACAEFLRPRRMAVGGDARLSTAVLKHALIRGLVDGGSDVVDLGMTGTEEVYFAASHLDVDGGIEVTASHNPGDYNGMKLVGRGAVPIGAETGLRDIQRLAETNEFAEVPGKGTVRRQSILSAYVSHLMGYIDTTAIRPMTLVVNAGNGAAGHVIDEIERRFRADNVPVKFVKIHHEPDGTFPNGIPNPLLPENRAVTSEGVHASAADMGIAWDGDFDRCFLFDEQGMFIEGYYIVGLLAQAFLVRHPGEKIIHDPRLVWNTIDLVRRAGGVPVQSRTGHAFIKECMRQENAIYGGEMSAHHYFRDFAYCDSGMIPWLLVLGLLSREARPLSALVGESIAAYPCSGELNYHVDSVSVAIEQVLAYFSAQGQPRIDRTDGISFEFDNWRFNLRGSNTEPLLRLNVETRGKKVAMAEHIQKIERLIGVAKY